MEIEQLERIWPWMARLAWAALLLFGWAAVDSAVSGRSPAVAVVAYSGAAVIWLVALGALAFPSVATLTIARAVVPLGVVASGLTLVYGEDTTNASLALVAALVALAATAPAEFGRVYVQASAYGEEDRFVLKPPVFYLIATGATWAVGAGALVAGPLLLAAKNWLVGGPLTVLAAISIWFVRHRWNRLAQRWLVLVPIGVVIHDPVVLSETVMLRRQQLDHLGLALTDTQAADLTGPATGHAVEIRVNGSETAIYAGTPKNPGGKAIHFTAVLVAPSRPGAFLTAANARRLPV